jgi:YHS domain-containing protein
VCNSLSLQEEKQRLHHVRKGRKEGKYQTRAKRWPQESGANMWGRHSPPQSSRGALRRSTSPATTTTTTKTTAHARSPKNVFVVLCQRILLLWASNIQQNTKEQADLPPRKHSRKHKIAALAFPKETAIARQTTEVVDCCLFGFESLLKSSAKGTKYFFSKKKKNRKKKEAPKSFLKQTKHKSKVAIFRKYVLGGSRQNKKVDSKILSIFPFSPLGKFGSFPLVDG